MDAVTLALMQYSASSGGGTTKETVTGNAPITLSDASAKPINSLTQYGLCTKTGADIYCNNGKLTAVDGEVVVVGSPEVLTVSGDNLYDDATRTDGKYINSSGDVQNAAGSSLSDAISVQIGKKYTFVGVSGKEGSNNKRIVAYSSKSYISSASKVGDAVAVSVDGVGVPYNVTIDLSEAQYAKAKYIIFSFNTADTNVACFEVGSGQTASVPMLLSVGDVKDEVELIAGAYTHRCAACEYDGTQPVGDSYISTTGGKDVGAIIVYPLAKPTTEHITAQNLNTAAGTNVVSVTAEVSPIELEAVYKSGSGSGSSSTWLLQCLLRTSQRKGRP